MSWNQTDLAFKILINKRLTSDTKKFYEEFGDNTLNIHMNEIWSDTVPSIAADTLGVVKYYDNLQLIADKTVPGNFTYITITNPLQPFSFAAADDPTNPRLKNWISDKYGNSYNIQLYSNGNQIYPADSQYAWFFNYQTGILTFNNATPPAPITIKAYRYIGRTGVLSQLDLTGTRNQSWSIAMDSSGIRLDNSLGNLILTNTSTNTKADIYLNKIFLSSLNIDNSILVSNLNVPYLNGHDASYFLSADLFNTSIGNINSSISLLFSNINSINGSINFINTNINAINASIGNLNASVGLLGTQILNINSSINNINTSINDLRSTISNVNSSLNNYINKNDASILSINASISNINSSLNDLPNKYVTLDTVQTIDASKIFNKYVEFEDNVYVKGNVTIDGSLSARTMDVLNVSDNYIIINKGLTGTPPNWMQSGFITNRGDASAYGILFDEASQSFKLGKLAARNAQHIYPGDTQSIATREDNPNNFAIAFWDPCTYKFITNKDIIAAANGNLTIGGQLLANSFRINSSSLVNNLNTQYLNGKESSYYADKTWSDGRYLPLTGGTLTGSLSIVPTNASPSLVTYSNISINTSTAYTSSLISFSRNLNTDFNGIVWNNSTGTRSITLEYTGYPGGIYLRDNLNGKNAFNYDLSTKYLYLGNNNEYVIAPNMNYFSSPIKTDTISNYTAAQGVLIEQVRVKTNNISNSSNLSISTPALNMDACVGFGINTPQAKIDMSTYFINKAWNLLTSSERTSHIKLNTGSNVYVGLGVSSNNLNIVNDLPVGNNYIRFWQNQKNSFTMDASYNLNVNNGDIYITNPSTNPTVSLKSKTNKGANMQYNASLNSLDFVFF